MLNTERAAALSLLRKKVGWWLGKSTVKMEQQGEAPGAFVPLGRSVVWEAAVQCE